MIRMRNLKNLLEDFSRLIRRHRRWILQTPHPLPRQLHFLDMCINFFELQHSLSLATTAYEVVKSGPVSKCLSRFNQL